MDVAEGKRSDRGGGFSGRGGRGGGGPGGGGRDGGGNPSLVEAVGWTQHTPFLFL